MPSTQPSFKPKTVFPRKAPTGRTTRCISKALNAPLLTLTPEQNRRGPQHGAAGSSPCMTCSGDMVFFSDLLQISLASEEMRWINSVQQLTTSSRASFATRTLGSVSLIILLMAALGMVRSSSLPDDEAILAATGPRGPPRPAPALSSVWEPARLSGRRRGRGRRQARGTKSNGQAAAGEAPGRGAGKRRSGSGLPWPRRLPLPPPPHPPGRRRRRLMSGLREGEPWSTGAARLLPPGRRHQQRLPRDGNGPSTGSTCAERRFRRKSERASAVRLLPLIQRAPEVLGARGRATCARRGARRCLKRGVVQPPALAASRKRADAALRDVASGHGRTSASWWSSPPLMILGFCSEPHWAP